MNTAVQIPNYKFKDTKKVLLMLGIDLDNIPKKYKELYDKKLLLDDGEIADFLLNLPLKDLLILKKVEFESVEKLFPTEFMKGKLAEKYHRYVEASIQFLN